MTFFLYFLCVLYFLPIWNLRRGAQNEPFLQTLVREQYRTSSKF